MFHFSVYLPGLTLTLWEFSQWAVCFHVGMFCHKDVLYRPRVRHTFSHFLSPAVEHGILCVSLHTCRSMYTVHYCIRCPCVSVADTCSCQERSWVPISQTLSCVLIFANQTGKIVFHGSFNLHFLYSAYSGDIIFFFLKRLKVIWVDFSLAFLFVIFSCS